jgi:hypothetical protein
MDVRPGVTEKTEFEELALTRPLPQPAARSSAGARSIGRILEDSRMVKNPTYIVLTAPAEIEKRAARLSFTNSPTIALFPKIL